MSSVSVEIKTTSTELSEFNSMTNIERASFIENNYPASKMSTSKRGAVHGYGINDAPCVVTPRLGGVQVFHPAYTDWRSMLGRCYCEKYINRYPTYRGVSVCDEWLTFSSFREWWLDNQVDGWQLDKDMIGNGLVYSPDMCIFIPGLLNSFTLDTGSSRGEFKIGACYSKKVGKFISSCRNPISRKSEHLGYFCDQEQAHNAWLNRKLELAMDMKVDMDAIDERIYVGAVRIIKAAK